MDNIHPDYINNFVKKSVFASENKSVEYDYGSIMHYEPRVRTMSKAISIYYTTIKENNCKDDTSWFQMKASCKLRRISPT